MDSPSAVGLSSHTSPKSAPPRAGGLPARVGGPGPHTLEMPSVLTDALVATVIAALALTIVAMIAGRRPSGRAARMLGLAVVVVAPVVPTASLLALLATVAASIAMPRRWYAVGSWLFAALLVSFTLYAAYLVRATWLLGGEPLSLALGVILLALQVGAMGLLLASSFEMVDALCAPPVDPPPLPFPERPPVVCLQVPTYNEPPELVIETLASLVAIDYPALRVQVIDNNTTDPALWQPVQAECARLARLGHRVEFVHLPTWPGYKGGALNWGLAHLADDVEVVGVVDADYLADPAWLRDAVPHFSEPRVAFVQTPQDYRAWQDSAFYRACYIGFGYFFKVGMVSRARRDAIIFAGTMGLIRRSALEAVGGWDETIITEDAEISVRILERGYRPVYLPRPYGRGIMPLTYEGLRKQRYRWAFGGIQILRRHGRTLLSPRSNLTLGQRYDHILGGLWWFNDALTFGFAVFVAAAAVGEILGRPFVVQRLTSLGIVLPVAFIGLNLVRYLWGLGATMDARPPLALAALRVNMSLSWVIALACARALVQDRAVFLRTPKFRGAARIREVRMVWIEAAMAAVGALLAVLVLLTSAFSLSGVALAVLLGWSAVIYGSALGYALGDPERAPLGRGLADKARLEIAPRVVRAARSRPARAGLLAAGVLAVAAVALAVESSRPPVEELPFSGVAVGPVSHPLPTLAPVATAPAPSSSLLPAASPSASPPGPTAPTPSSGAPVPSRTGGPASPGPTPAGPPTASPPPTGTPGPTRSPTPLPSPSAVPKPTPPVPLPSARPTSSPRPTHSRPPAPTPSVPPHP
jgi:glycosyltransferase involved in cell wall biosynthesis